MASLTGELRRLLIFVVFLLVGAFMVLSLTKSTYTADDVYSPIFKSKELKNVSRLPFRNESQVPKENETKGPGDCKLDRTFLPEGSRPMLLLLSFPGSGNTWVRYLIERSTGIYSGSLYNDLGTGDSDSSVWRKSNPCSKKTLVVKSHGWEDFDNISSGRKMCKVKGAILIIRNPYGAILAEFNRQKKGKTGTASVSQFLSNEWKNFAETYATEWLTTNRKGMKVPNKLVIFYEDLVSDTDYELRRILDFLKMSHNERRIACLLSDSVGKYKRAHKKLEINPYSAEINKTIDARIKELRKFLQNNSNIELPPYESSNRVDR